MDMLATAESCEKILRTSYEDAKNLHGNESYYAPAIAYYCSTFVSSLAMLWVMSGADGEYITNDEVKSLITTFSMEKARRLLTDQWLEESLENILPGCKPMEVFNSVLRDSDIGDPLLAAAKAAGWSEGAMNPPTEAFEEVEDVEVEKPDAIVRDWANPPLVNHPDFSWNTAAMHSKMFIIRGTLEKNGFSYQHACYLSAELMNTYGNEAHVYAIDSYPEDYGL